MFTVIGFAFLIPISVKSELLGCESTSCYHFLSNSRTWNESRSECIKLGGDLAVIDNQITHDFVSGKLFELLRNGNTTASEVWLGAKAVELDKWYWEDDSELVFSRWTTGYPQNDMYVAAFDDSQYHWKDQISPYNYRYLCDGTTELCNTTFPSEYITIWPSSPRLCLLAYVGDKPFSWHGSQSRCGSLGTTLATVDNEETFLAVQRELTRTEYRYGAYWIGLHKERWTWVDGRVVNFNIWDAVSPDETGSCLTMHHIYSSPGDYEWQDNNCNEQRAYLCRLPPGTTLAPTTTATTTQRTKATETEQTTPFVVETTTRTNPVRDSTTHDVTETSRNSIAVLPWILFSLMTATSIGLAVTLLLRFRRNKHQNNRSSTTNIRHPPSDTTPASVTRDDLITPTPSSVNYHTLVNNRPCPGMPHRVDNHMSLVNESCYEMLARYNDEMIVRQSATSSSADGRQSMEGDVSGDYAHLKNERYERSEENYTTLMK